MIYIPPIAELSMYGILEAGVPNRERICLRPTDTVNLAYFGIFAAVQNPEGFSTPMNHIFFWFGEVVVTPPSWIVVFTGKGTPPPNPLIEHGMNVYPFFWNLERTLFNIPNVLPVVFKIGAILKGSAVPPHGVKQLAS